MAVRSRWSVWSEESILCIGSKGWSLLSIGSVGSVLSISSVGSVASIGSVASAGYVSPLTAKTHVNRAMMKLGARDRAQLVVAAYQSGLVRASVT